MSGRTRKANRYVKSGLCQAAWAASHTKNTYLSAFYQRLQVRKGAPKAVMALAHHMIAIIYNVLARREPYVEMGPITTISETSRGWFRDWWRD